MSTTVTHNLVADVALDDNLVLALRVLANATSRRKFGREELGGLFQVDAKQLETLDVRLLLAARALGALDDDLAVSTSELLDSYLRGVLALRLSLGLLLRLGLGLCSVGLELLLLLN